MAGHPPHWQPRASTQWNFSTGRAAADAPGDNANEVVVQQGTLAWTERWRADLRSTLTLVNGDYRYHNFISVDGADRHDSLKSVELGVRYDLRPDLQIGLFFSLARRSSNKPIFDYTRRVNGLVLQLAL